MIQDYQKITIIRQTKPVKRDINKDLQWFGSSFGLFGERDKDRSCFRVFVELVKTSKVKKPLTSDEIASNLSLTRGTVVHHLNKLLDSGLAVNRKNRYFLRVSNFETLTREIDRDLKRTVEDLKEIAKEIDDLMGF